MTSWPGRVTSCNHFSLTSKTVKDVNENVTGLLKYSSFTNIIKIWRLVPFIQGSFESSGNFETNWIQNFEKKSLQTENEELRLIVN